MLKEPLHHPSMPEEVTPPAAAAATDSGVTVTHDLGCSCDDEVGKMSFLMSLEHILSFRGQDSLK